MKTVLFTILTALLMTLISCSKKNNAEPRQQGDFVKGIALTFPVGGNTRNSTFGYDEENRIKVFEFQINGREYITTFTYNDADLVIRADIDIYTESTDRNYGYIFEFAYDGDILVEYKLNSIAYPVAYNAAENSYSISFLKYHWDANNNLKKITHNAGTPVHVSVNYLSRPGLFKEDKVQMAFAIFSNFLASGFDARPFHHAMEHFAFSKNEIGGFDIPIHSQRYFFYTIRNDAGNIIAYEIKNEADEMVRKYEFTYEKRDLE